MDLNPTFGHQELLETLSQQSGATNSVSTNAKQQPGDNHSLRSNRSNHNANNNDNDNTNNSGGGGGGASSTTNHVNEAVRRLGYRLSVQAHGGDIRGGVVPAPTTATTAPQRVDLQARAASGFVAFFSVLPAKNNSEEEETIRSGGEETESADARSRTNKVAKTRYSDHGEHQHKPNSNSNHQNISQSNNNEIGNVCVTRKLTVECRERFRRWEELQRRPREQEQQQQQQQQQQHSHHQQYQLSPTHRFSFSKLALDNQQKQQQSHSSSQQQLLPPPLSLKEEEDEHDAYDNGIPASLMGSAGVAGVAAAASVGSGSAAAAAVARRRKYHHQHHHNIALGEASPGTRSGKSLLSAVMEAESATTATNTSTSDQQQQQQRRQQQYLQQQQQQHQRRGDDSPASQSISTKDSKTAASKGSLPPPPPQQQPQSAQHQSQQNRRNTHHLESKVTEAEAGPPARGRCLTTPSEPVGNGGLDNAEGNLIVYENDSIVVKRKNMRTIHNKDHRRHQQPQHHGSAAHSHGSSHSHSSSATNEFRVQGLQGQGTFAQVFQCLHVQTNRPVAVKIIKNKPVYTRQAAIEIDIFQTLQQQQEQSQSRHSSSNKDAAAAQSPGGSNNNSSNNLDYMVNLDFYFMHQNHLCLVFELLGWNLYEVLKRRQFRGLPMPVVREIVRQVLEGCRDLSQKNVVHCDLKPENILLLSEEANARAVAAGDAATVSSSHGGGGGSAASASDETPANLQQQQQQQHSTSSTNSHATTAPTRNREPSPSKVKIIDFGSACFEGYTAHTYIQSRFYRSPEVLMGLPYDSAIDLWSLGCVAAELFLGLPILPGVHEHDQLVRIAEMIATLPEWMVDQGSKSTKYYVKFVPRPNSSNPNDSTSSHSHNNYDMSRSDISTPSSAGGGGNGGSSSSPTGLPLPQWRLKTQQEYIASLSQANIRKKGGLEKLQKQPGTRYFKQKKLSDILFLHVQHLCPLEEDRALVPAFVHFLYGILDPDPWKRWTAFQAAQHPFVTGNLDELRPRDGSNNVVMDPKEENQANLEFDMYWPSPWDPAICRRKLLNVQKMREKQQSLRRSGNLSRNSLLQQDSSSLTAAATGGRGGSSTSLVAAAADPMMVTDGSTAGGGSTSNNHPPREAASPPTQISSSTSTSRGESTGYVAPVNWQQQQQQQQQTAAVAAAVNQQSQMIIGNSQVISDTQSTVIPASNHQPYSGAHSLQGGMGGYTPTAVDFAQALMRPGVIPGSYGMGTSVASQSTTASLQFGNNSQTFSHGGGQSIFMQDAATTSSSVMPNNTMQGAPFEQYLSGVPGQVQPPEEPFRGMTSATSSVTMTEAASHAGDSKQLEFLAQQQTQQLAFLQQQQMMQQSFQQQQQQFALQQPMLASGPGGFYYVTTSSTGQPILLQPVGLLNQQGVGGQMFMNAPSGTNQQQQQPMAFNQQAFVQQQGMNVNSPFGGGGGGGGGIPQYLNQGPSQQFPMQQQQQQPQQQMQYQQPQPQQQQQQQRYFAPPPPREPYRHGRGGGTSY